MTTVEHRQEWIDNNNDHYNVNQLWMLTEDLPVFSVPVWRLEGNLDNNEFSSDSSVTPRAVLAFKSNVSKQHWKRVVNADLSYPILVRFRDDRIIDGMHRFLKALHQKNTLVSVRFVRDDLLNKARV